EAGSAAVAKAHDLVGRAKAQAAALIAEVRRAVAAEWDRLKRAERSRPALEESRRRLRDVSARVTPASAPPPAESVTLAPGMTVAAEHLGLRGELVSISGDSATVRSGTISVRVPVAALRPAEVASVTNGARRAREIEVPLRSVAPELMLIGRTTDEARDLVGRFVNLRKAGQNFKGLCPFHAEKTPSFMVNPKKGIFHCFGCGVGGDVFGFLMRQDRLSFPEAVRVLAKQAGVALPEDRGG